MGPKRPHPSDVHINQQDQRRYPRQRAESRRGRHVASPGGRALWRQLGKRHPVDKALSNIRGPVTAKLCEVITITALQNALFVKSQRSGSGKCTPPPLGQGERLNVKSRFHSQPNLQPANFPKAGAKRLRPVAKRAASRSLGPSSYNPPGPISPATCHLAKIEFGHEILRGARRHFELPCYQAGG